MVAIFVLHTVAHAVLILILFLTCTLFIRLFVEAAHIPINVLILICVSLVSVSVCHILVLFVIIQIFNIGRQKIQEIIGLFAGGT